MPEYVQPRGRSTKSPLWARLCVIFGAVLLLSSGVALVGTKFVIDAANRGVNQEKLLPDSTSPGQQHATITGAKTILLIGTDARPGEDPSKTPIRADSIMLLHVDASHNHAYIVSIPRDTYVHIPAQPKTRYAGNAAKINAAFAYGGLELGGIAGGGEMHGRQRQCRREIDGDGRGCADGIGSTGVSAQIEAIAQPVTGDGHRDGSDVEHHDADRARYPLHRRECRDSAAGRDHVIAVRAKDLLICRADRRIIVDDEQKRASFFSGQRGPG